MTQSRATPPVQAVGRCGERMPGLFDAAVPVHCALLATHLGWHRSEQGTEWSHDFDGALATLRQEAQQAIEHLAIGLHQRGLLDDAKHAKASRVVGVALEEITAQRLALDEYAAHVVELEVVRDGRLSADQEIRARALDVAGRKFGTFGYDTQELLACADRLAGYIRDGVAEDPHLAALLTAAIVLAQGLEGADPADLSEDDRAVIAAVDAFLASRHTLRDSAEERSDDTSNDPSKIGEVS